MIIASLINLERLLRRRKMSVLFINFKETIVLFIYNFTTEFKINKTT